MEEQPPPYSATPKFTPHIRPATKTDVPAISAIHTYYAAITNSLIRNRGQTPSDVIGAIDFFQEKCKLPYLVATVPESELSGDRIGDEEGKQSRAFSKAKSMASYERVVGYALAHGHQPSSGLVTYWRTAEIYVHVMPQYKRRGVGGALVKGVVDALKRTRWVYEKDRKKTSKEQIAASIPRWTQVLAILLLDRESSLEAKVSPLDQAQKGFWEAVGFVEKGRLNGVVEKRDGLRDVWYFQKSLV